MRRCPAPDCGRKIKPGMFACKPHWFEIPKDIRNEIWATWRRLTSPHRSSVASDRSALDAYREAERKGLEALGAEAEPTIPAQAHKQDPLLVHVGDLVEDDYGDARRVAEVELPNGWVVLKDGTGDALIVGIDEKVTVRG